MFQTRLEFASLSILAMAVVVAGAGGLLGQERTDPAKKDRGRPDVNGREETKADVESHPGADRIVRDLSVRQLRNRTVEAARRRLETQREFYEQGRIVVARYLDASQQLMTAETRASETRQAKIAAARAHLDRLKDVEHREQEELKVGRGTAADVAEVAQRRAEAELDFRIESDPDEPPTLEGLSRRLRDVEAKLDRALQALERERGTRPGDPPRSPAPR